MSGKFPKALAWIVLACLVVPMFGSYFFDDMFSSVSYLFDDPSLTALGWSSSGYGLYASGYSVLCVFGGLVVCGILLDKWGVRITGSIFVGMMFLGAAAVLWALLSGSAHSLQVAYVGCMFFGLGSEIAGTAVTRSIAKWFKHGPMALAMGLQLAIARLGTAFALVLSPKLIAEHPGEVYTLAETARPAAFGLGLLALGLILWAVFVAIDAKAGSVDEGKEEPFKMADVAGVFGNGNFWLLSLLCVLFYSSIIAFKKFAGAILVPRFDIPAATAGWMVSMLPFATVVFAPLFGILVDRKGKGTRWMILGAVLALAAHILLAFAPQGTPFWGYLSMVFLGFGYSLVPAALWPSVTKIVPARVLGTTYALIYWVQNLGLLSFKMLAGAILDHANASSSAGASGLDAAAGAPGLDSAAGTPGLDAAAGAISDAAGRALSGPVAVELMFVGLCVAAIVIALLFARSSRLHPELGLDAPSGARGVQSADTQ